MRFCSFSILVLVGFAALPFAHQPVFDMAPRWAGGYGFQVRYETVTKDELELDGNRISNPNGLEEETMTTWVEGVYTFTRAFRITLKLPYIKKEKRFISAGVVKDNEANGFGDIIIGSPIKYYFNKQGYTGNFSFTPSFYIPTGSTSGPIRLGRGTVDYGVGTSFSAEAFYLYTLLDVFTRINTKGNDGTLKGNTYAFDWDLGIHPLHNNNTNTGLFLMVGLNGRKSEKDKTPDGFNNPNSGGQTFEVVPTVVFYRKNFMWRTQYHIPTIQHLNGIQLVKTMEFQTGVGFTF